MPSRAVRPLSALLSQALVAFTIEFDNEFERRMREAGYPGALVSLGVWSNLLRFLAEGGLSVHDLAARSLAPDEHVTAGLGCLERWIFVVLLPDPADARSVPVRLHPRAKRVLRDGWGSGRGIRSGWIVRLTQKGRKAAEIWPPLFEEIERRWRARFGDDEIRKLGEILKEILDQIGLELPEALPVGWDFAKSYPARRASSANLPLPALLSQLLLAFTLEFDRESPAPLVLCANALRVLGEEPIPESDLPRLTGGSPETSGIGWQIKPYITVEPVPRRGKMVRLNARGLRAQQTYRELTAAIEKRWGAKFGKERIRGLREALLELFVPRKQGRAPIAEGLAPAEGTVRSGEQAPALGRRDVGSAARQRMRDLVAQTRLFLEDPANTLPHYPLWDMNRGFGP